VSRSLETRVRIVAPVGVVWQVLTDTAAFAEWTDDVGFRDALRAGASLPMRVRLFGVRLTVPVALEAVEPERELRWRGGPPGVFVGSHYFRLGAAPDGGTELVHGEDFRGVAVPLLLPVLRGELLRLYGRINDGLRGRAEAIAATGPGPSR
jgi:hypothetical protein